MHQWMEALTILDSLAQTPYEKASPFEGADYGIAYSWLNEERCPEASELGQRLVACGWHIEDNYWCKYV